MYKLLYVGGDAHRSISQITVVNEEDEVLKRKRVPRTAAGVRSALGRYRRPLKSVLEASYGWGPMYDWLGEVSQEVLLAHPAKVRAIAEARIKTDRIDSRRRWPTCCGRTELEISGPLTRSLFNRAQRRAERLALAQRKSVLKSDKWLDEYLGFAGRER